MTHPVSRRSEVALARLERGELAPLARKVLSGERLDAEDGLELYRTGDLLGLGCLANLVREARHGDVASFVRNVHVNPTNVCAFTCEFCAFGVKKGQPDAYETNLEEVARTLEPLGRLGLREVHMVGGVHPDWPYETWLDYVRTIRRTLPDVGIKAYTAVEIDWMARISGRSHAGVLADLLEAGLTALPGGGAEIFHPEVRRRICRGKVDAHGWLEIHRAAHALGIPTNATMLYGHLEEPRHRVDHLVRLRRLQDEAPAGGGFLAYVPLAFHPRETSLAHLPGPTERQGLREVAVARLLLDNVPHVTGYWVMLGAAAAQLSLAFGADDLSGTIVQERITHAAGGVSGRAMTAGRIAALALEAGRVPVERDTLYRPVSPALELVS